MCLCRFQLRCAWTSAHLEMKTARLLPPLHIHDSAIHRQGERPEVTMLLFFIEVCCLWAWVSWSFPTVYVLHIAVDYTLVSDVCQSPSSYVLLVSCLPVFHLLVSQVARGIPCLVFFPFHGELELRWRISHASYTYILAATEGHAGQMHMWQDAAFELVRTVPLW